MHLVWRPARRADLDECLDSARDRFAYSDREAADLHALWIDLLESGSGFLPVVEDTSAPAGQRIVWYSFKAFVSDEFAAARCASPAPITGRQILASLGRGEKPLLTREQVARGNRNGGLNMIVLNFGAGVGDMLHDPKKRAWIGNKSVEWAPFSTYGYRLKRLTMELYGDYEWRWAKGLGLLEICNYARNADQMQCYDILDKPRLFGIDAHAAIGTPGTATSLIFRYEEPIFSFNPAQQEMLLHALGDGTDEAIAAALCVANATIRKRWENIYAIIQDTAPNLFAGIQGSQRRRIVIAYMRQHIEELRPLARG